jgi:hypothetical protein
MAFTDELILYIQDENIQRELVQGLYRDDFVYYTKSNEDNSNSYGDDLYRLNVEANKAEKVLEDCGAYPNSSVAFTDDYILYIKEEKATEQNDEYISTLYMLNGEGSKKILSGSDIVKYIYLIDVQVLNGKIFVKGGEGAFNSFCVEIDINGKVLSTVYSD